jgi:hypothetical protein
MERPGLKKLFGRYCREASRHRRRL